MLAADFGDAPDSYATLFAADGARHEAVGLTLGVARTEDLDGQPTIAADGDIGDDGVVVGPLRAGQMDAVATITVQGVATTAFVDAWIDFNGDGSFGGPHERIAAGAVVQDGENLLHFPVPVDAAVGGTFARFRLSTAGVAGPGGAAPDGEVEDYVVTIAPPRSSAGEFGAPVRLNNPQLERLSEMLVEDADGDGDLDFYTISGTDTTLENSTYEFPYGIYRHENLGDGRYDSQLVVALDEGYLTDLLHADFNSDGRFDFVSMNLGLRTIDLFEQTSNGQYLRRAAGSTGFVTILKAADLDNDYDLDVVGVDVEFERVLWFENDGTGNFTERVLDDVQIVDEQVLVTDLDGDDDLDIVYAAVIDSAPSAVQLAWLENDGQGNYVRHLQPLASASYGRLIAAGDFDDDGDVDLFVSQGDSAWLENDGAETFTPHSIGGSPTYRLRGEAVDIDADGDLDVVASSWGAVYGVGRVVLFRSNGAGSFTQEDIDSDLQDPIRLRVADFDADGRLDVVMAGSTDNTISYYRQSETGAFDEQVLLTDLSGTLHAFDLDQDGDLDFLTRPYEVYYDTRGIWWYEQVAPGRFVIRQIVKENRGQDVTALDMDGDGDLDLLSSFQNRIVWYENDGEQNFTQRIVRASFERLNSYAPVDYDGDGDIDVLFNGMPNSASSRNWLLENDGQQNFSLRQLMTTEHYGNTLVPADLDGDGDMDVLVGGGNYVSVAWFEQTASGMLVRHVIESTISNFVSSVAVADLDADGDIDIVADNLYYINNGGGNYTRFVLFDSNEFKLFGHKIADLDGDGLVDIAATVNRHINYYPVYENGFVWYRNLGGGQFAVAELQADLRHASSIAIGDIDRDGDLDTIMADAVLGELWYQENLPVVSLHSVSTALKEELGEQTVVKLRRGGDSAAELAVGFMIGGTASYGDDYTILGAASIVGNGGTVVFPAGVDEVQLVVSALDDALVEADETIELQLVGPSGYLVVGDDTAAFTLTSADFLGDYGDAPASYRTTLAADGARHLAVGPRLGAARSAELEGAASADSSGDAGDDGLANVALRAGDTAAAWQVQVANAAAGAVLDAWIDFNADGTWDDATERVALGLAMSNGANEVNFAVPATAVPGVTFARLRLSTAGVATFFAAANDGEVEDYAVAIESPVAASGSFGLPQQLSGSVANGSDLAAIDFDGDGDIDLIVADRTGNKLEWIENRGAAAAVSTPLLTTASPRRLSVADFNGDGRLDLLTFGGAQVNLLRLHLRQADNTFTSVDVATFASVTDLVASDIDADGNVDFLAANGASLAWFENDGSQNFVRQDLAVGVRAFDVIDFNGDGRLDVLTATTASVGWLEQAADGSFAPSAVGAFANANDVAAADFDGDGNLDVWAASTTAAAVFEREPGSGYTTHALAIGPWGVRNTLADLDGDGDVDLISGQPAPGTLQTAIWYENRGDFDFAGRNLAGLAGTPQATAIMDWNGDGQLDWVATTTAPSSVVVATAASAISVSSTNMLLSENPATSTELRFTRRGDLSAPLTVSLDVGGVARFGGDYMVTGAKHWSQAQGQIEFPAGAAVVTVTLTAVDDALVELDEQIVVSIQYATDFVPSQPASATITLRSDEYGGNFGDAPSPYPTLLASNGAAHQPQGPQLGPTRGYSPDGSPSPTANSSTDDDGVTWHGLRVGQAGASLSVDVRNAAAKVDVWLDWNGDGSWNSVDEHVIVSAGVTPGLHQLEFEVPAWAASGTTFARVRISSTGIASPQGLAADGEVEDYAVVIESPFATTPQFAEAGQIALVSPRSNIGVLTPVDFDRDGDVDLISSGPSSALMWHENRGPLGFAAQNPLGTTSLWATQVVPDDYDNDGDLDLVVVAAGNLEWLENTGIPTFIRHLLTGQKQVQRIAMGDFDGAGGSDIVALLGTNQNGQIAWMRPDAAGGLSPESFGMASQFDNSQSRLLATDFDRDGDLDIVVARPISQVSHEIVLFANDGGGDFTQQVLAVTSSARIFDLLAADLDADGDIDLMTRLSGQTANTRLAWWEQAATGELIPHTIDAPHSLGTPIIADVNGDSRPDIVAVRPATALPGIPPYPQFVSWLGSPAGTFTYTIDPALPQLLSNAVVDTGDLDQDGDLDLVSISSGGAITWYRNLTAVAGDYDRNGVVEQADYDVWRLNFGATAGSGLRADGNSDGKVDAADYTYWRDRLPMPGGGSQTVAAREGELKLLSAALNMAETVAIVDGGDDAKSDSAAAPKSEQGSRTTRRAGWTGLGGIALDVPRRIAASHQAAFEDQSLHPHWRADDLLSILADRRLGSIDNRGLTRADLDNRAADGQLRSTWAKELAFADSDADECGSGEWTALSGNSRLPRVRY